MAKKRSYWEKLQDPRWQRRRLERLQAEGWKCQFCLTDDHQLHIHHTFYERGVEPWEYPDESLLVLCDNCHEQAQETMAEATRMIGCLDERNRKRVYDFVRAVQYQEGVIRECREDEEIVIDEELDPIAVAAAYEIPLEILEQASKLSPPLTVRKILRFRNMVMGVLNWWVSTP